MFCCCGTDDEEIVLAEVPSSHVLDPTDTQGRFRVSLDLNASSPQLGIEVDNTDLRGSMILHISEDGLVQRHNELNPQHAISVYDRIVSLNGEATPITELHRLRLSSGQIGQSLVLVLSRPKLLPLSSLVKQLSQRLRERLPRIGALPPRRLLQLTVQPPPMERLEDAVRTLAELGALTTKRDRAGQSRDWHGALPESPEPPQDETARITVLGRMAIALPLDLRLCRLILFGVLFGCAADAVVMATALKDHLKYARAVMRSLESRSHFDQGALSEPIMLRNLFRAWLKGLGQNTEALGTKLRFTSGSSQRHVFVKLYAHGIPRCMDYTSIKGPDRAGDEAKVEGQAVTLKADPQLAKAPVRSKVGLSRGLRLRGRQLTALGSGRFRLHEPGVDEEQLLQGLPSMAEVEHFARYWKQRVPCPDPWAPVEGFYILSLYGRARRRVYFGRYETKRRPGKKQREEGYEEILIWG
eukprot:g11095.t1